MYSIHLVYLIGLLTLLALCAFTGWPETPEQKDTRMKWWREARFGLFVHWGLYSIPAGQWNGKPAPGTGEWLLQNAQIKIADYEPLLHQFNPVKFDARAWVRLAKRAGMKYLVITSKHHEGFCLWYSALTDFNVMNTPFKRDILAELSTACEAEDIRFCTYHSILDWHHPDYLPRRPWDPRPAETPDFERYIAYLKGQLEEIVTRYHPAVMWFDGEWEETWTHEYGVEIYHYLRALDPNLIINNRVDTGREGFQGMTNLPGAVGDFGTPEQEIPPEGFPGRDWESCMTMNDTWGYRSDDHNWKSAETLIRQLIDCASRGGNYLLNVGPTGEGEIPQASIDRLNEIGDWMNVNSGAII
jgi:alpha-L-fucosidase